MSVNLVKIDKTQLLGAKPDLPFPKDGWIAGGAIRGWFSGTEKLVDIDIFFNSEEACNSYSIEVLKRKNLLNANPNAETYSWNGTRVQCIRRAWYPTKEDLLDSFDFTVCQFVWDGIDVYATPEAIVSVLRNHLGAHNINKEFAVDSLRRAFKYCKRGYHPCNGTIEKIALSLQNLTPEEIRNAVEISPNGGKRIIRID